MNVSTHNIAASESYRQASFAPGEMSLDISFLKHESCLALEQMEIRRTYSSGDSLFWEDDKIDYYYFINSGHLKRYKLLPNGRSQIISFMIPGDFLIFPERDVFACTAEAMTELTVTAYPQYKFDKLLGIDKGLRELTFQAITCELSQSQRQILLLGRMAAGERVSSFLYDYLKCNMESSEKIIAGAKIRLPMTRAEIADYLGLTIETVSRIFSKLRKDGIIELPKPNLVYVCKPESLRTGKIVQE